MAEYIIWSDGELYHHGVKGMKWGVRRYQNKDGTLTKAGKKRVAKEASNYYKQEAAKREQSSASRVHEINDILESNKIYKMSDNKIDALLREVSAIEGSVRTLRGRSQEIDRLSKLGERYIQEYAKNVPVDKILKAYSDDYAYYQYNIKGDKEWLLNWDDKKGPKFD